MNVLVNTTLKFNSPNKQSPSNTSYHNQSPHAISPRLHPNIFGTEKFHVYATRDISFQTPLLHFHLQNFFLINITVYRVKVTRHLHHQCIEINIFNYKFKSSIVLEFF